MPYDILIVEDHPMMRQGYATFFEDITELNVCGIAETAENALEHIAARTPALVLMDVSLPGMDGLELARRLRLDYPTLRTVVTTGYAEPRYAEEALEHADAFVVKGDVGAILETIMRLLQDDAT